MRKEIAEEYQRRYGQWQKISMPLWVVTLLLFGAAIIFGSTPAILISFGLMVGLRIYAAHLYLRCPRCKKVVGDSDGNPCNPRVCPNCGTQLGGSA